MSQTNVLHKYLKAICFLNVTSLHSQITWASQTRSSAYVSNRLFLLNGCRTVKQEFKCACAHKFSCELQVKRVDTSPLPFHFSSETLSTPLVFSDLSTGQSFPFPLLFRGPFPEKLFTSTQETFVWLGRRLGLAH